MTRESNIETCALTYVKWIAGGNLLYDPGNTKLVLCDNVEEGDGEGEKGKRNSSRKGIQDSNEETGSEKNDANGLVLYSFNGRLEGEYR